MPTAEKLTLLHNTAQMVLADARRAHCEAKTQAEDIDNTLAHAQAGLADVNRIIERFAAEPNDVALRNLLSTRHVLEAKIESLTTKREAAAKAAAEAEAQHADATKAGQRAAHDLLAHQLPEDAQAVTELVKASMEEIAELVRKHQALVANLHDLRGNLHGSGAAEVRSQWSGVDTSSFAAIGERLDELLARRRELARNVV